MKTIYLAFKMIWKQKFLNLFLVITVTFSIYYLCPVLSQIIHYANSVSSLKGLDMENAFYLYSNPFYNKGEGLRKSIEEKMTSLDYITGHAEFFNLSETEKSFSIMVYNEWLINHFTPELSQGIWLKETVGSSYVPVVVTKSINLPCGEVFPLTIISGEKTMEIKCEVIGLLEDPARLVGFSGAADEKYFTADILIQHMDSTIILPLTESIKNFINEEVYLLNSNGSIIYTTGEITYEEVLKDFGYAGIVTDLGAGNNRFYEQSKIIAAAMGMYAFVYFLITVICLLCSSFILGIRSQKTYVIYYLSGMSHWKRIQIEGMRIFLLVFINTVISYLFMSRNGSFTIFFEGFHPFLILLGVLCYISLIFIPISVGMIMGNKDRRIIEEIRRLDT